MRHGSLIILIGCGGGGDSPKVDAPVDTVVHDDLAIDAPPDGPVACTADDQCSSGVCHERDAKCVDEAKALYTTPGGNATGDCTRTDRCTIVRALELVDGTRFTIALEAGTYTEEIVAVDKSFALSGPARAPSATLGYLVTGSEHSIVTLTNGTVTIEGVRITGGDAIRTAVVASGTTLLLDRSAIHDNGFGGLQLRGSSSGSLADVEVYGNASSSLQFLTDGPLSEVTRLFAHDDAVVIFAQSPVIVTNSIFSQVGYGIYATPGPVAVDYVTCHDATSACLYGDTQQTTASNSIFSGGAVILASVSYSMFDANPPAGVGNFTGDPKFVDPANDDLHIGPNSGALNNADPSSNAALDFDGQARPQGGARDVGADER